MCFGCEIQIRMSAPRIWEIEGDSDSANRTQSFGHKRKPHPPNTQRSISRAAALYNTTRVHATGNRMFEWYNPFMHADDTDRMHQQSMIGSSGRMQPWNMVSSKHTYILRMRSRAHRQWSLEPGHESIRSRARLHSSIRYKLNTRRTFWCCRSPRSRT